MRKSLLLFAGIMLAASPAMAHESGCVSKPAYFMPGAEIKLAKAKALTASAQAVCTRIEANSMVKAGRVHSKQESPNWARIAGTALDLTVNEPFTIDTLLVTGVEDFNGRNGVDGRSENKCTITYDKNGRRATMESDDDKTRYTYTIDNQNRWLSRVVEKYENHTGKWRITNKEERTISGDRVTSVTLYQTNYDYEADEYRCMKSEVYELEYGHGKSVYINGQTIGNAAITHLGGYDENGDLRTEERYAWMDAANEYIRTYYSAGSFKEEAVVYDDYVVTTSYQKDGNGRFVKYSEETMYYGKRNGYISKNFDENGTLTDAYGSLTETYFDEQGNKVEILYGYVDSSIVPEEKYVYSPDCLKEVDYSVDFDREEMRYVYENGDWQLAYRNQMKHHLLSNGLSEVTVSNSSYTHTDIVKAEKVINDGYESWVLYAVEMNSDGSFVVVSNDNGDYIYKYYTSEGALQKTIRQTELAMDGGTVFFVMMPGDTEWSTLDEYTVVSKEGSVTLRTVYKTNADGRPASVTEYVTMAGYNNGSEFKSSETLYTYSGVSNFVAETYEVYTPSDVTKLAISEKIESVTLSDGTRQITHWEYDDNGKGRIDYASRTEYKDYITRNYSYNTRTGVWSLEYAYCDDENYVTADGVSVTISHHLSDDGMTVINDRKTEYKEILGPDGQTNYLMSANYNWDSDKNCWIGQYKSENKYWSYTFECHSASEYNPVDAYNDEYMVVLSDNYSENYEHHQDKSLSYEWDYDKNDWKLSLSDSEDFDYTIDGDVLTTVKTESRNDEWETSLKTETVKITRDASKRIVQREEITDEWKQPVDGAKETYNTHYITYYTYNESTGLLAEEKQVYMSDEDGYFDGRRYIYGKFTIEPFTGINEVANDKDTVISIEGNRVSAPGLIITIYGVSGMVVSSSANEATLPEVSGVYIVKAGNSQCKVLVK